MNIVEHRQLGETFRFLPMIFVYAFRNQTKSKLCWSLNHRALMHQLVQMWFATQTIWSVMVRCLATGAARSEAAASATVEANVFHQPLLRYQLLRQRASLDLWSGFVLIFLVTICYD